MLSSNSLVDPIGCSVRHSIIAKSKWIAEVAIATDALPCLRTGLCQDWVRVMYMGPRPSKGISGRSLDTAVATVPGTEALEGDLTMSTMPRLQTPLLLASLRNPYHLYGS